MTGCSSGYRSNKEKASLFCFPSSAELREKWKRAIPRLEAGGFSFESKNVRVCEKHFDASDVVRTDEHIVNGVVVSLQRERPRLRTNAVPRIFDGLPAYLTKPQTKSRGYLKVPSSRLLALLKIVEEHVETYTVQNIACGDVYARIVEGILLDSRTASASVGCLLHFLGTTAEVVHFFLRCRLHFFTREKNKASRATVRSSCPASGGRKPQC